MKSVNQQGCLHEISESAVTRNLSMSKYLTLRCRRPVCQFSRCGQCGRSN